MNTALLNRFDDKENHKLEHKMDASDLAKSLTNTKYLIIEK